MKKKFLKLGVALLSMGAMIGAVSSCTKGNTDSTTSVSTTSVSTTSVSTTDVSTTKTTTTVEATTTKKVYDMSGVSFNDKTITYDGKAHTLEITGTLPEGVKVAYTNNTLTDVGEITVIATFVGQDDYEEIPQMTATLTITQSSIEGLTFESQSVLYDGNSHLPEVEGNIPEGVTVNYSIDAKTLPGEYSVTATLVDSTGNYKDLPTLTATLEIIYQKEGITYEFDYENNEATIISNAKTSSTVSIVDIELEGNTYTVDELIDGLFDGQNNLTEVTIASSITKVPTLCFNGCSALATVNLSSIITNISDDAFKGCSSLETITLPEKLEVLGQGVFKGCTSLTSLSIPKTVTEIGDGILADCNSLESLTTPFVGAKRLETTDTTKYSLNYFFGSEENSEYLYEVTYKEKNNGLAIEYTAYVPKTFNALNITDSEVIPEGVCSGYTSLGVVTLPNNVIEIRNNAFDGCTSLEIVDLDIDTLKTIGSYAFRYTVLKDVTINKNVESLGQGCLSNTDSLQNLYVPFIGASEGLTNANLGYILGESATANSNQDQVNYSYNGETFMYTIPKSLKYVYVTNTKAIPANAFNGFVDLEEVAIEDTVTSIGDKAFIYCESLNSVSMSDNVTSVGEFAFAYCTSITSVSYKNKLKSIGYSAYFACDSLKTVSLEYGLETIGEYAFSDCPQLQKMKLPFVGNSLGASGVEGSISYFVKSTKTDKSLYNVGSVPYYDGSTLTYRSFYLPLSLTTIEIVGSSSINASSFAGLSALTNVTLPSTVKSIPNFAFYGTTSFDNLDSVIGANVTTIGIKAFSESGITAFSDYGTKLSEIGSSAFQNCSNLTTAYCGYSLTSVPTYAFSGSSVSSAYFGSKCTSISSKAFYNCNNLTSIATGSYVTKIYNSAFEKCANLATVNLPAVTLVDQYAFYECKKLTNLTAPVLETINTYAFSYTNIKYLTLDAVKSIGNYAFKYNLNLTTITLGPNCSSLGTGAFSMCSAVNSLFLQSSSIINITDNDSNLFTYVDYVYICKNITTTSAYIYKNYPKTMSTSEKVTIGELTYTYTLYYRD